jgi:hypothetical protein
MNERSPSVYPSYKPDPVTDWMAVARSGLIPRKATLELPRLPANRGKRRFPRSRTRVATPFSENASHVPSGEERRVDTCHKLGSAPGRAVSTASRARFHVGVRLPVAGSAANTTCSRTRARSPKPELGASGGDDRSSRQHRRVRVIEIVANHESEAIRKQ